MCPGQAALSSSFPRQSCEPETARHRSRLQLSYGDNFMSQLQNDTERGRGEYPDLICASGPTLRKSKPPCTPSVVGGPHSAKTESFQDRHGNAVCIS